MNKVIFQNARIIDPDQKIDTLGSLIVEDKKIEEWKIVKEYLLI